MSFVKLDTGFNIQVEFPIAPFHKRLIAWVLDLVIQGVYLWLMSKLLLPLFYTDTNDSFGWVKVLYYIPIVLYHLLSEIIMNGQSLGKKSMGIKVITIEGGQPTISQYTIRWLFRSIDLPVWIIGAVSMGGWPYLCIFLVFTGLGCVIASKKSQRVGDLIAGTVVIDTKNNTSWQDTVFMEVEDTYTPVFPQVMKLSDRDINTIRQIMGTTRKAGDYEYANRVTSKIKVFLKIESDLDAFDFMELLLKDYNYLSVK